MKDEIAKSGVGKLRYLDSELHFKSKQISSSRANSGSPKWSRQQQANLNTVQEELSTSGQKLLAGSDRDLRRSNLASASAICQANNVNIDDGHANNNDNNNFKLLDKNNVPAEIIQKSALNECSGVRGNTTNCGGCLVRDMSKNLSDLSRMVQEQNEQLQRLKGRCLRSYFERLNVSKNSK